MNQKQQCPCKKQTPEQYVTLPAQMQNKYTPYYQSYDQQATGNIGETSNILTQYTQTTKQTTNYDLMQSFPAVNGVYLQNQMITNNRPIPIYDANGIGAAQRAQYGLQQRQFDNNIKSGVNIIASPQIQDIQMSLKPNNVFQTTTYNNVPAANLANAPFQKMNPDQSGLVMRVDNTNYSSQPQEVETAEYAANPTEVQSPDYNQEAQVISPETGSNVTDQEIADIMTTPEQYDYLEGFRRFAGLRLQGKKREMYSVIAKKIKYDSQGLSQQQIIEYNLKATHFILTYLEGVIIGKINGIDITPVWKKNMNYVLMNSSKKKKVQLIVNDILNTNNLKEVIQNLK